MCVCVCVCVYVCVCVCVCVCVSIMFYVATKLFLRKSKMAAFTSVSKATIKEHFKMAPKTKLEGSYMTFDVKRSNVVRLLKILEKKTKGSL